MAAKVTTTLLGIHSSKQSFLIGFYSTYLDPDIYSLRQHKTLKENKPLPVHV